MTPSSFLFLGSDKYVIYVENELNSTDNFVEKYVLLVDPSSTSSQIDSNSSKALQGDKLVPQQIISSVSRDL